YEKVFRAFVSELDGSDLMQQAHTFYVGQVSNILGWTDLTDSRLLAEIRTLDNAFRTIVRR
ncbi:hypothetical protein, partial [Paenibacillus dendritiformis]|uniref:hypothetical protein n=1 Tax=Paenibacillus dendritiformis TaxID=130049 RepID=UPI001BCD5493